MTYSAVPVEKFGGLNLNDDPGEVGWRGAVDISDVEPEPDGSLRSRDFNGTLVANTAHTAPVIIPWPGLPGFVTSSASLTTNLYNSSGGVIATGVATVAFASGQSFGTLSANYLYLTEGAGVSAIRRLTAAGVHSAPAGMPSCKLLGNTPWDNRLVAVNVTALPAGSTATSANGSLLHFSDVGDGETWGANNWVQLDPGDGEVIAGVATWGNQLFVFKQTKFYVFYGTSTDSGGNPVFNYRRVAFGTGVEKVSATYIYGTAVAGEEGVYFSSTTGIYRTTGGDPIRISRDLDPIFQRRFPAFFTPGRVSSVNSLRYVNGRLYCFVSFITSGAVASKGLLIYDPIRQSWLFYSLPSTANSVGYVTQSSTGVETVIFTVTGANAPVYEFSTAYSSDVVGGGPACRYRSGFSDLGSTQRKRVREWILEGSGSPTFKTSYDFGSLETGATVTLGTAPAVAEARRRYAIRGRHFSWQLSASTAFSVNNLVAHVDEKRAPGTHA